MNKARLEYLVKNYLLSQLSEEDEQELISLMTEDPDEETQALFSAYYHTYSDPQTHLSPKRRAMIWRDIHERLNPPRYNWKRALRIAATFLLISSVLGWLYIQYFNAEGDLKQEAYHESISLRKVRANIYSFDNLHNTEVSLTDEELERYGIKVDTSGIIRFVDPLANLGGETSTLIRIKSNQAQVLQIVLSDGSTVWLNSHSELTMPSHFMDVSRRVSLSGEAYFEVAKSKLRPFFVETGQLSTKVLGTRFNVSSFEPGQTKVTLLEGKVMVTNPYQSLLLSPGQQAIENQETVEKVEIDTLDLLAWKEGYFKFEDASTEEIMNQIKDWYEVKYIQIDARNKERFSGTYKRTNQLRDLLKNLEEVSRLTFKIKEGGIYVVDK